MFWRTQVIVLAVVLGLLAVPGAFGQDSDVSGAVTDERGKPIPDVRVFGNRHNAGGGYGREETKTDANGTFILKQVGKVLEFRKPRFRPATKVRDVGVSRVDVVLQSSAESNWEVPACSTGKERGKRYGLFWSFLVPRGTKVKVTSDVDYWCEHIFFRKDRARMIICSGPLWGATSPWERLLLNASDFTERGVSGGYGTDFRGKTKGGKNWRWFGGNFDSAEYSDASDDAARFFDQVIDSVCIGPEKAKSEAASKKN